MRLLTRTRSRRPVTALATIALGLALWLPPATARAEKVDAKELLRRANAHYNLGRFLDAAKEYETLYESHPDQPVLLYDVAQAYRQGGDSEKALFFYKSYLREAPDAPNRKVVEDRVAQLEKVVEAQRSAQQAPPNDTTPPGGTPRSGGSSPSGAQTPAAVATATQPPPPAPAPTPIYKKWWAWAAVGAIVVVGVGVGVGVGVATSGPSFSSNVGADIGPGAHAAALASF